MGQRISIHALLAESDQPDAELYTMLRISIHALLAESDIAKFAFMTNLSLFLSTLSLRRATQQKCGDRKAHVNFYPRSPCGERRLRFRRVPQGLCEFLSTLSLRRATLQRQIEFERYSDISIHALLAESDTPRLSRVVPTPIFLSTLSLRRATPMPCPSRGRNRNFYPRSPCGERRTGD